MNNTPPVQIKGRVHPLAMLLLRHTDVDAIMEHLAELRPNAADAPDLLAKSLICLDCSWLGEKKSDLNLTALVTALRDAGMTVVSVKDPAEEQMSLLPGLGCILFEETGRTASSSQDRIEPMVLDKPVRCGQSVYAQGRDLVVLAGVNPGAEVLADGSIHVYGALRGRALAGAQGDMTTRVHCAQFQPELVGVAGVYLTSDELVGQTSSGPVCILLDGEELALIVAPHGLDPSAC